MAYLGVAMAAFRLHGDDGQAPDLFADAAVRAGVVIHTDSPVVSTERSGNRLRYHGVVRSWRSSPLRFV